MIIKKCIQISCSWFEMGIQSLWISNFVNETVFQIIFFFLFSLQRYSKEKETKPSINFSSQLNSKYVYFNLVHFKKPILCNLSSQMFDASVLCFLSSNLRYVIEYGEVNMQTQSKIQISSFLNIKKKSICANSEYQSFLPKSHNSKSLAKLLENVYYIN